MELVAQLAVVFGTILLSMTLHEAMHGYVAYWLGDDTAKAQGRLTLNPIHHIDPFLTLFLPLCLALIGGPIFGGAKPVPFNPERVRFGEWGAALIGIAGPLTNLVLAFIFYGLYVVLGGEPILAYIFSTATAVNLGFFVFNMLPIPPLDGSRVLYALAPEFIRRGMEFIEQYGVILVFMLVIFASGFIGQYMSAAIAFFVQLFSALYGVF